MTEVVPIPIEIKPNDYPDSAIQLLRTMQAHHVSLSQMADQKAGILMASASVVFSITVGQVTKQGITAPFLSLGLSTFAAAAFAVAAILPSTRKIRGPNANILFFGAFVDLTEAEFKARLTDILHNENEITQAMLRDVYQLGMVLHRKKYRYLAAAYRVFLTGLLVTFIVFVAQAWMQTKLL